MDTSSIITGTTLNRYQLDIPSCTASLDVEEFSGAEKLSELYYYTITFTSAEKNIDAAQLLSKPAMLTMGGGALQQLADCKRVHGVVTAFRRISSSEDQSKYQITLEPFLSLLDKQFRSHRFFVNKSVPEVVEQVLQEHHLHDWEYEFYLKQHYPRREQINQYQESDLAFIQRLLAEVGIFYFFTLQEEAQSEVVHFADAQRALMFDKTLPVNSPSGMSDSGAESIWGLSITHNVVEANVTTRDYNPRDAQSVLQSATADMTRGNGEGITYGEVYHYKLRHREALRVSLLAVPYSETLCWRPPLLPRPKVTGTMTARVTSAKANDIYAWQDASGLYRVKFDPDRDEKGQGQESMPVRLAKPYGGDVYGFHFPLIQGTEVAIAFHEGDPDRPYIAHALHDSRHVDPVTEKNSTRNVIRTPTNNKLRMEDKRGEEHIKLSTEYGGKTQLNLGHNVNAQRELRGEGAELRTDKWVSIRGGAGVFISADKQPSAGDRMLAMEEAIAQLENALGIAKSLASAAESAQALPSDTGNQQTLNDALKELAQPGIVLNAPQGVSISSPQAVRLSSGSASVGIVSQQNTDISALKRFTVAAGEAVSLLARKAGMKLFAAKGKIEIQAQDDALEATAKKDITVTSVEGRVEITAAEELVVNCAGAYIRLSGGNIELGCPGNILLKSANVQKMGAADYDANKPELPVGFSEFFTAKDEESGEILPFTRYRITTGEGKVFEGRTDAEGKTVAVYTALPDALHIELL
ncbi:TPA: DUF2345 domain-containing protein [Klebsiella pneumoniae]